MVDFYVKLVGKYTVPSHGSVTSFIGMDSFGDVWVWSSIPTGENLSRTSPVDMIFFRWIYQRFESTPPKINSLNLKSWWFGSDDFPDFNWVNVRFHVNLQISVCPNLLQLSSWKTGENLHPKQPKAGGVESFSTRRGAFWWRKIRKPESWHGNWKGNTLQKRERTNIYIWYSLIFP